MLDWRPVGQLSDAFHDDTTRAAGLPEEAANVAAAEMKKLRRMSEQQPGFSVLREYLQWMADLPWSTTSVSPPPSPTDDAVEATATATAMETARDTQLLGGAATLAAARATLDRDHRGLERAKERIVQYVAVRRLRGEDGRAPILCLAGPPGVGKTSLAKSIASVLGRPFCRYSRIPYA